MNEPNKINEQTKDQSLEQFRQDTGEYMTTNEGVRISNTNDSLKANVAQEFIQAIAKHRHWTRTQKEMKPVDSPSVIERIVLGS